MYSSKPSIVYGFHGLDKTAAYKILTQKDEFRHSDNDFDWLGYGIYFWENNLERAKQYAEVDSKRTNSSIKDPFVLGAVIELGNCLDLMDQKHIDFIKIAYEQMVNDLTSEGKKIPINQKFGQQILTSNREI